MVTGLSMKTYAFDPAPSQARPDHVFKTAASQFSHSGGALTSEIGTMLPNCTHGISPTTDHGEAQGLNGRTGT